MNYTACPDCNDTGGSIGGDGYCHCAIGETARKSTKIGSQFQPPKPPKPPTAVGLIDPEPKDDKPINGHKNPRPQVLPERRLYDRKWRPGDRG